MTKETVPSYASVGQQTHGQEPIDRTYSDHPLYPNGIHARTGRPLLPPIRALDVAAKIFGQPLPAEILEVERVIPPNLDWNDLRQTGWGVIFPEDIDPKVEEALSELLKYREAAARGPMFKRFDYPAGASARQFLAQFEVGPEVIDPEIVPYYLLIVGSPEEIPFSFQYQLGTARGVGRLHFEVPEDYRRYARQLVLAETQGVQRPRVVTFFGVEQDPTTHRSVAQLVAPLAERLIRQAEGWGVRTWIRGDATKERLGKILSGEDTPGLLVTTSHGVGYDSDDSLQLSRQGALLCRDKLGAEKGPALVSSEELLCGADIPPAADLQGLFAFLFACYSAGTPQLNDFVHENGPEKIADHDFVARLPQRLLRQGALGVIGHVDRAWTCTFSWTEGGGQVNTLETVLLQLLRGHRAGHAMSFFGHRYAELATQLTEAWENSRQGKVSVQDGADFLAWLWTAHNDARNMVLLGDPAARRVEVEP